MTIQNIVIDVGVSVFEPGMAYVAFSRATTLNGLHIIHVSLKNFIPSYDVLEEYSRLRQ